jgi:hypothetical protein
MHHTDAMEAPANVPREIFPVLLLFCLAVSSCGNTCISGFWTGNQSQAAVSNTSCPPTKATGAVTVQMSVASASSGASAVFPPPFASPNNVEHIFVTLRGIEAHPDSVADADSPDWQELAPDLAAHPMQVDLLAPLGPLAPSETTGDSGSLGLPANADVPINIPADEYRQLRLRLAPLHPSPDDLIPESNACGNVGWNCIILADRSVRPLQFDGAAAEFHITPEQGTDSLFRVLPGEVIHLSIEFDPASSVFFASNDAVRLVPIFRAVSHSSSPPANAE